MEKPKISILTPSLNSVDYIERAIKSVIHQDYDNFEHVIVDAVSTDGTLDIIKKFSHIKWISEPDTGQSNALNKAFSLSSGEIIVSLNADDYFEKNAFNCVLPHFLEGEKFIVGNVRVIDQVGKEWINYPKISFREMLRWWEPHAYCYNSSGYFYAREVQESIKYNENNQYPMDLEFLLDASIKYKFKKIENILGTFRIMPGTKTADFSMTYEGERTIFNFCDDYLGLMDPQYKEKFLVDKNDYLSKKRKEYLASVSNIL